MPELPEVEMRRRFAEQHGLGRQIARARIPDATVLRGIAPRSIQRALQGGRFTATRRHGKWLFLRTEGGRWVVLHFGMTGRLQSFRASEKEPRFVRLCFEFSRGPRLAFTDPRKFGWVGMAPDVDLFLEERGWGPDPTMPGFDRRAFRKTLAGRTGLLKGVLLNQRVIAGIGNLYADEMLFQAGLHPETRVAGLRTATMDKLYDAMMAAFEASLAVGTRYGEMPASFLLRHRNDTGICPKCGKALASMKVSGRTTLYCRLHQRRRS
jgi:formamidopyrimidine-DNA glycosylase